MIYPWQTLQWQQWVRAMQTKKLPHALLLTGITGLGKLDFAKNMVRAFFCKTYSLSDENAPDENCQCHACQLMQNGTHPNVLCVYPEKPGQAIKIDAIREACEFISQTAVHGEYRFVIIEPADKMNTHAANALLKTLEEPSAHGILLLVSDQADMLPATIISRCRRVVFSKPSPEMAENWLSQQSDPKIDRSLLLKLANGAPLKALQLSENELLVHRQSLNDLLVLLSESQTNPLAAANKMQKLEPLVYLDNLIIWSKDLLHLKLNTGQANVINQDFLPALLRINKCMSLSALSQFLNTLIRFREQIQTGVNLNKQLLMETLFYRFQECGSCI